MNNKGFTLVELLAIILLLALISTIGTYAVSSYIKASRIKSDEILWSNIKTASQEYIDECTSGVSSLSCTFTTSGNKKILNTTLENIANLGFLNTTTDSSNNLIILDSNKNDIKECNVTIEKEVNPSTFKVEYTVTLDNNCGNIKNKTNSF